MCIKKIAGWLTPQSHPALPFDALEGSDGQIAFWMGNGDGSGFGWMPELAVAPFLPNFPPSIGFQQLDDFAALHSILPLPMCI